MHLPHFLRRFGFLLWKNTLWKVRNWRGTLLEILFPTFLFILLIILKHQNPTEDKPLQHRAAKALPSAGLVPFMQTVYCDMDNRFSNRPDGLPDFHGSKVDSLYKQLAEVFNKTDGILSDSDTFQDTFQQVSQLLGEGNQPPTPGGGEEGSSISDQDEAINDALTQLCTNVRNRSQNLETLGLESVCNNSAADVTRNLTSDQRTLLSTLAALGPGSEGNLTSLFDLYRDLKEDQELVNNLKALSVDPSTTLCGSRGGGGSSLLRFFTDNSQSDSTRIKRDTASNNTHNNTTGGLKDTGVRIIFTPNNSLAWGIVREMNTTIHYVDVIRDLLNNILKQNREVENLLDRFYQQDPDQGLVKSLRALAVEQRVQEVEGLPSSEELMNASKLLNRTNSPNLWDYTHWVDGNVTQVLNSTVFRTNLDIFRGYRSEEELVNVAGLGVNFILAGLVFQNLENNDSVLPPQVRYKIRSNGYMVNNPNKLRDLSWKPGPGKNSEYLEFGFIFIQDMLERAIINLQLNATVNAPGGYIQPFPFPCYINDDFLLVLQGVLPLVLVISSSLAVSLLARVLTFEKEQRLQDMLSLMGVGVVEHWCSWIVVYFFLLLPSTCFNWALLTFGGIMEHSDKLILFLVMITYNLALMSFAILGSVPFKKANIAGSATGLIYFLLFFLTPLVGYLEFSLSVWEILLVLLLSPSGYGLYIYYNVQFEVQTTGIHWNNIFLSPYNTDRSNPLLCLIFLLLDTVLYFWLAFYLQAILPGVYGVRRPWYFPLDPRYWLGTQRAERVWRLFRPGKKYSRVEMEDTAVLTEEGSSWEVLAEEEGPEHLFKGVEINKLGKVYSWGLMGRQKVAALHCLSLDLYEGQITALLGHNGAGKTSLMMILSGIVSHSSGSATIYGKSLKNDISQLRNNYLGLCPQHSILYNHLTVDEHLLFYGSIRGLSSEQIRREANNLLVCMRLIEHRGKQVQQLSGGMRRKLCVCLSFLGSPKLVVLDEPTAGIDPYSRRHIWDFLMSQREKRCILLSTHHMDEAEVVGDRIAIIDHGHLLCVGGLPFLKQQFQLKYLLRVEKESGEVSTHGITELIETHLSATKLEKGGDKEVQYSVPLSLVREDQCLSRLFAVLENAREEIGISSFGFEAPTLEQLFLKLTELRYSEEFSQPIEQDDQDKEASLAPHSQRSRSKIYLPFKSCFFQFYALTLKRLHHTRRDLKGLIIQYFLFLLMLLLTLWISTISPYPANHGVIRLTPTVYEEISEPNQFVILGSGSSPVPSGYPTAESYLETTVCPGGLGVPSGYTQKFSNDTLSYNHTNNILNSIQCPWYSEQKWSSVRLFNKTQAQRLVNSTCSCDTGEYICPAGASGPQPATLSSVGDGSILLDLRRRNLTDYLLKTQHKYLQLLYGGVSFGLIRDDVPQVKGDIQNVVNKNIREYNSKISFETFVERDYSKAWFSLKGYHAMPIYLNVMNNAVLRRELADIKGFSYNLSEYGIVAASEPWPATREEVSLRELRTGKPLMVPLLALFGFCFLASSFVLFVLEERVSGTKHLQSISGLNKLIYWTSSFAWDLMIYTIAIVLGSLVFLCFDKVEFVSRSHFPVFFSACMAFGCVSILLMYMVAWFFSSPSKAYVVMFCMSYVIGMIFMVVNYSYDFINRDKYADKAKVLENVFLLFPTYSFVKVLYQLILISIQESVAEIGSKYQISTGDVGSQLYEFDMIWKYITVMLVEAVLLFWLNLLIDLCVDFFVSHPLLKVFPVKRYTLEDNDVIEEEERVLGAAESNTLTLTNLYKHYFSIRGIIGLLFPKIIRSKQPSAVRNITLGVNNECFGLLGLNGAGKTSVFNMITGVRSISRGSIKISGQDIHKTRIRAYSQLGYCAQYDSLFPMLTAREHLHLYGRLRGMTGRLLTERVSQLITRLYLREYADLPSGKYSGGNKRKLSTAIALISHPSLLLLDEPTAGIDPYAKQFLWKVIRDLTSEGVSSMLTTHSMSECEALCTRIGILKDGRLQCIGSPQHLKSKYGQGYVMKFYLPPSQDHELLLREVERRLPHAQLKNEHQSLLDYSLEGDFKLSETLSHIFQLRREFNIQEFSIGQTTLDDVFLKIVSDESEAESSQGFMLTTNK